MQCTAQRPPVYPYNDTCIAKVVYVRTLLGLAPVILLKRRNCALLFCILKC